MDSPESPSSVTSNTAEDDVYPAQHRLHQPASHAHAHTQSAPGQPSSQIDAATVRKSASSVSSNEFFARLEKERMRQQGLRDRLSISRSAHTIDNAKISAGVAQENPLQRHSDHPQQQAASTPSVPVTLVLNNDSQRSKSRSNGSQNMSKSRSTSSSSAQRRLVQLLENAVETGDSSGVIRHLEDLKRQQQLEKRQKQQRKLKEQQQQSEQQQQQQQQRKEKNLDASGLMAPPVTPTVPNDVLQLTNMTQPSGEDQNDPGSYHIIGLDNPSGLGSRSRSHSQSNSHSGTRSQSFTNNSPNTLDSSRNGNTTTSSSTNRNIASTATVSMDSSMQSSTHDHHFAITEPPLANKRSISPSTSSSTSESMSLSQSLRDPSNIDAADHYPSSHAFQASSHTLPTRNTSKEPPSRASSEASFRGLQQDQDKPRAQRSSILRIAKQYLTDQQEVHHRDIPNDIEQMRMQMQMDDPDTDDGDSRIEDTSHHREMIRMDDDIDIGNAHANSDNDNDDLDDDYMVPINDEDDVMNDDEGDYPSNNINNHQDPYAYTTTAANIINKNTVGNNNNNITDNNNDITDNNTDIDSTEEDDTTVGMPRLSSIVSEDVRSCESSKLSMAGSESVPKLSSFESIDTGDDGKSRNTATSSMVTEDAMLLMHQRRQQQSDLQQQQHHPSPQRSDVRRIGSIQSTSMASTMSPGNSTMPSLLEPSPSPPRDRKNMYVKSAVQSSSSLPSLRPARAAEDKGINEMPGHHHSGHERRSLSLQSHTQERKQSFVQVKKTKPDYSSPVGRYPRLSSPDSHLRNDHRRSTGKHNHTTTTIMQAFTPPPRLLSMDYSSHSVNNSVARPASFRSEKSTSKSRQRQKLYTGQFNAGTFASYPRRHNPNNSNNNTGGGGGNKSPNNATAAKGSTLKRSAESAPTHQDASRQANDSNSVTGGRRFLLTSALSNHSLFTTSIPRNPKTNETWVYLVALLMFVTATVGISVCVLVIFGANGKRTNREQDIDSTVRSFLSTANSAGTSVLGKPASPQKLALDWVQGDRISKQRVNRNNDRFLQRYALASLWHATSGDSWDKSYGFLSNTDECDWYLDDDRGIKCDDDGYVTGIRLANNGLNGELPQEISHIATLEALVVQSNTLVGTLPTFEATPNLATLDVGHNFMRGKIALMMTTITNLETLDLSSNIFSGTMPSDINTLTKLRSISVGHNRLGGSLDALFQSGTKNGIKELQVLNATNNLFGGNVSTLIEGLAMVDAEASQLETLDISSNSFVGSFPATLGGLASMKVFNFAENQIAGSLPNAVGALRHLKQLHGDRNRMTGPFPWESFLSAGSEAAALQHVTLAENYIQGSFPSGIGALKSLQEIDFESNHLTGELPSSIGGLLVLKTMQLSRNRITGEIPTAIGELYELERLDVSSNRLGGMIPSEIGNLNRLTQLDLNSNKLTGSTPPQMRRLARLNLVNLYDNEMEGEIEGLCEITPKPLIAADCGGPNARVRCRCCTICFDGAENNSTQRA